MCEKRCISGAYIVSRLLRAPAKQHEEVRLPSGYFRESKIYVTDTSGTGTRAEPNGRKNWQIAVEVVVN